MIPCKYCGEQKAARALGICASCLRDGKNGETLAQTHLSRQKYGLPYSPPRSSGGKPCLFCANECHLLPGERGFCGLRTNQGGRIQSLTGPRACLAHIYYDPLPTNCCAAWFCRGSREKGVNLAVFFYGCNFDCLFCQNASHRSIDRPGFLLMEDLVQAALAPEVRCVCFFGGSPEPQLPFAIQASREILRRSGRPIHICWEWNGAGHPSLARKAVEISRETGGTVKFDLKAWTPAIGQALCGVPIRRAYENLTYLGRLFPERDLLTATTLLVPYYVDETEVEGIARFLAGIRTDFPYSLLIFHPDDRMIDLPVTPRYQVTASHEAARRHLERVNIGNLHLLGIRE